MLVPTGQFIRTLQAARLAADVAGVPTILVARTDALAATLLTSDVDEQDRPFLTGERTAEGYFRVRAGLEAPIARAIAYAPYADLLWCETSTPDLDEARRFAEAVHAQFPGKLLAYNCSPSFNWRRALDEQTIARFQKELAAMGYRFQFITLAGFHSLNAAMFELAAGYAAEALAYVRLQQHELALEPAGYTATRHARSARACSTWSPRPSPPVSPPGPGRLHRAPAAVLRACAGARIRTTESVGCKTGSLGYDARRTGRMGATTMSDGGGTT